MASRNTQRQKMQLRAALFRQPVKQLEDGRKIWSSPRAYAATQALGANRDFLMTEKNRNYLENWELGKR